MVVVGAPWVNGGLAALGGALERALAGGDPLLCEGWPPEVAPLPGTAVGVLTSGSTGPPRGVCLGAKAIASSVEASRRRLGVEGRWLLALPTHRIAGLNVVIRSLAAGHLPQPLPPGPFTPAAFLAALAQPGPAPRLTSLVPTQLIRLMTDDDASRALTRFDAVLLGGAAPPPDLVARARAWGIRVVETYGMAETCGGCVYDGRPLDGVRVRISHHGQIQLSTPTLALGYPPHHWFTTQDLGHMTEDGSLVVDGRADTALTTGGITVHPERIEAVLAEAKGVAQVVVVGVPDPEWGTELIALVEPLPGHRPEGEAIRQAARAQLDAAHTPRRVVIVRNMPLLPSGKPDRVAALAQATR